MVEKAVDVEAKANLQPLSETKEIDSRYLKRYRPSVKKDKDNVYQEHRNKAANKDKEKAQYYNPFPANQPQTQASKKH